MTMLIKPNSCQKTPSAAATTNATLVKSSPGYLFAIIATNTTASVKYLKLYNKASVPTVGTDIPLLTIALPVSNAPIVIPIDAGMYFNIGLAYAMTGAAADADATALAAGDVVGLNVLYN